MKKIKLCVLGVFIFCALAASSLPHSNTDEFKMHVIDYLSKHNKKNISIEKSLEKSFRELDKSDRRMMYFLLKFIAEKSMNTSDDSGACLFPCLLRPDGLGKICSTHESSMRLLNFLKKIEDVLKPSLEEDRFKSALSQYLSKNKPDESAENALEKLFCDLDVSDRIRIYDGLVMITASYLDESDALEDCCVKSNKKRKIQHGAGLRLLNFLKKIEHHCLDGR